MHYRTPFQRSRRYRPALPAVPRERGRGQPWLLIAGGLATVLAVSYLLARSRQSSRPGSAPQKALLRGRSRGWRESALVGRTVTINRPRDEIYAYWRDFTNLPAFMENVRSVTVLDDRRSRWVVAAPGDSEVEFESVITQDRPGELIAWETTEDSDIRSSGTITFRDAPTGRGTEVEANIAYDAPAGAAGRMAAKLFQREPNIQARRELKRFKQLMETGEISVTEPGPAAPRA